MHILIAEDDAVTRRLLEGILKGDGHKVDVAENGTLANDLA